MTGIARLRAQVEGGSSTNVVIPRAMLRDMLRQIEAEAGASEDELRDAWEGGYAARMAEQLSGEEPDL